MYIFYLKHCIKNELHVLYSIYIDNISYLYYTVKNDILKKKSYKKCHTKYLSLYVNRQMFNISI